MSRHHNDIPETMVMTLRAIFLVLVATLACRSAQAQQPAPGKRYVESERRYAFRLPSAQWRILQQGEAQGAHTVMAQDPETGSLFVVVTAPVPGGQSLDQLVTQREELHRSSLGAKWRSASKEDVLVAGIAGKRLLIEHADPDTLLDERFVVHDAQLYLLQVRYRKGHEPSEHDARDLLASFAWLGAGEAPASEDAATPSAPDTQRPPIPIPLRPALSVTRGTSGRVVLVHATGDFDTDVARFAMAAPLSDVSGCPACMLVGETLTSAQIDLLNRLPVREIVAVGEPPAEIAAAVTRRVEAPQDLLAPSPQAVVASAHPGDILAAVPEAFRLKLPLLIGDATLPDALRRLGVKQVRLVAALQAAAVPGDVTVVDASNPRERWQQVVSAGGDYLALANIGAERSRKSGAAMGAALLAARHAGMLLVIDQPVRFHYATLELSDQVPEDVVCTGKVAVGSFTLPEATVPVVVPVVGPLVGLGTMDKFGDALLDLDRDGYFDAEEEQVAAGDVRVVGGTPYSFSLRLIGAIGTTKFHDAPSTNRAVALSPPAEVIAEQMYRSIAGAPLPRFVLLAGDHRELPFDYVKDPVYAQSTMHEQELCTDNIYADPDRNGYLDVAVGRFVADSVVEATAIAARMSTYALLSGDWRYRSTLIYPCWPDDELKTQSPIVFASFEALMRGLDLDLQAAGFSNRLHLLTDGDLPEVYPHLSGGALLLFAHHAGPTTWLFRAQGHDADQMHLLLAPRSAAATRLPPGCGVVPPMAGAPVVISAGCDSAGLDYEVRGTDALVHAFFEQGAVAYLGNTRAGFPDTEEHLLRATLQVALGLAPSATPSRAIGEAFRQGKNYLDYLTLHRGPFHSTPPFEDYGAAMRREWTSLVFYGDPALELAAHQPGTHAIVQVSIRAADDGARTIAIELPDAPAQLPICIMEQIGIGPVRALTSLSAAGLCYGSTPWGTYHESAQPGPVAPGVFLDLTLPSTETTAPAITVLKGPAWVLGPSAVVRDALGTSHLQLAVDLIRYAMAKPEQAEIATQVVIGVR